MAAAASSKFDVLTTFELPRGGTGSLHSLRELERRGIGQISKLPVSIRILLG